MNTNTNVFFLKDRVIDRAVSVVTDSEGQQLSLAQPIGAYSRKTKAQLEETYGSELRLVTVEEAIDLIDDAWTSEPQVVSESEFFESLGCMPPLKWQSRNGAASFRMSEPYTGTIHAAYVCVGKQHFCFRDRLAKTHEELVAKVKASISNLCIN